MLRNNRGEVGGGHGGAGEVITVSRKDSYMADGPRISVNKLGEYLTSSSAVRRRTIIRQQKSPPPSIVPRYRLAVEPIEQFLSSGGVDVAGMAAAIHDLRTAPTTSDWDADDKANTATALERFLEVADHLPTDGIDYIKGHADPPKLVVSGVSISVRPDFLLYFEQRGRRYVGGLKIHFTKDDGKALRLAGQEYVATLVRQWLTEVEHDGREVHHKYCFSLDLFRRSLVHAPASYTRRMKEVEAACADIAALWPTI